MSTYSFWIVLILSSKLMIIINNSDRLHESKKQDLNEAHKIHAGVNVLTLIRPLYQFDSFLGNKLYCSVICRQLFPKLWLTIIFLF